MARPLLRRLGVGAAVLTTSLTLAACSGGDDDDTTAPSPSVTTTPSAPVITTPTASIPTAPAVATWPLTGLPRKGKLPNHPVYVVKVDNTSSAAPQLGLDSADMIVEELVEGGITRLAAFYYSQIPDRVGPVRSMRASDIGITEPANAFIVASGAAGKTMMLLNQAGINRITEGAVGFYRSSERSAPYNLMMHMPPLVESVSREWSPPSRSYLPFGSADQFHGTDLVHQVTVSFSGAHTDYWRLDGDSWERTNSYAMSGQDFGADNILVLRVRVGDAGYLDPGGNPVPETFFYGSGDATLIHGDRAVSCTWHKNGTRGAVSLRAADGTPITVPRGHTFVELVPADGGSVTLGR